MLASGKLLHVIVISLEAFAALQAGAPFGYAEWLGTAGWAALGNAVGGLGLVTALRLVQVGSDVLEDERRRPGRQTKREAERGGIVAREAGEAEATPR